MATFLHISDRTVVVKLLSSLEFQYAKAYVEDKVHVEGFREVAVFQAYNIM